MGVSIGVSKMFKFYVKVFYVMGKALSGELSCPCDRSCFLNFAELNFVTCIFGAFFWHCICCFA